MQRMFLWDVKAGSVKGTCCRLEVDDESSWVGACYAQKVPLTSALQTETVLEQKDFFDESRSGRYGCEEAEADDTKVSEVPGANATEKLVVAIEATQGARG